MDEVEVVAFDLGAWRPALHPWVSFLLQGTRDAILKSCCAAALSENQHRECQTGHLARVFECCRCHVQVNGVGDIS